MKLATEIFIVLCYTIAVRLVSARNALKFNKKKVYPNAKGLQTLNLDFDKGAHPQPLPTAATRNDLFITYPSIYQGVRFDNDVRVYRQRFHYNATTEGQRILCQGLFDCVIAYIAIESSEAIPVLLRGGVGYRHFMAIIKAKPNRDLRGQVRAYCRHKDGRSFKNNTKVNNSKTDKFRTTTTRPKRRFVFAELESTNDSGFDFNVRHPMPINNEVAT